MPKQTCKTCIHARPICAGSNTMYCGHPSLSMLQFSLYSDDKEACEFYESNGCRPLKNEKKDVIDGTITNGDKIRQMTDEELVKYIGLACKRCVYHTARISECADRDCMDGNLEWLKQEVSEDAGTD